MDGYQTTVLKAVPRKDQVVLWSVTAIFITVMVSVSSIANIAISMLAPFAFFVAMVTIAISRSAATAHLTWGPKGLCYKESFFSKTIEFNDIGRITCRIAVSDKKKAAFLVVEDLLGKERFKINTSLFDDSEMDTFIRCIENNTRATLLLAPMFALREERWKSPFLVNSDHVSLKGPKL